MIPLNKIIAVLKENPKTKFPLRYELELREKIVSIIVGEKSKMDVDLADSEPGQIEITKEVIKYLDMLEPVYLFQKSILRTYLNYFRKFIPDVKFNWQYDTPEYYIAVVRIEGKWKYFRIYPNMNKAIPV
jgi:hypothetical protein